MTASEVGPDVLFPASAEHLTLGLGQAGEHLVGERDGLSPLAAQWGPRSRRRLRCRNPAFWGRLAALTGCRRRVRGPRHRDTRPRLTQRLRHGPPRSRCHRSRRDRAPRRRRAGEDISRAEADSDPGDVPFSTASTRRKAGGIPHRELPADRPTKMMHQRLAQAASSGARYTR
jgi:hypothetical protein